MTYINAGESFSNKTERETWEVTFTPVDVQQTEAYVVAINLSGGERASSALPPGWMETETEGVFTKFFNVGTTKAEIVADFNQVVTKTGHTFSSWTSSTETVTGYGMTITAQWTVNQYTITFDTVGGTTIPPITQDYNSDVTAPADPTKAGYDFDAWSRAIPSKMPAEDITITASWTIHQYSITYNLGGGSNAQTNPSKYTIESATVTLANATRAYYTFSGWYSDVQGTTQVTEIPQGSYGDVQLWAKWTPITYTITFMANSGSAVAPIDYIVTDSAINLNTQAVTARVHYDFGGWYRSSDFTGTAVTSITPSSEHQNVILYAKWTVHRYTITYSYGAGTNPANQPQYYTVYDDQGQAVQSITVKCATGRTGYTCIGWAFTQTADDNTSGESDSYAPTTVSITLASISTATSGNYGNITLYAKYRLNWHDLTIQWTLDVTKVGRRVNVSGSKTKKFPYGSNIANNIANAQMDPQHTVAYAYGHTYSWNTSQSTMPDTDVTANAVYTLVPHTLTLYKTAGNTATTDTASGFGDADDWLIDWKSAFNLSDTSTVAYQGWHLSREDPRTTVPTWTAGTTEGSVTTYTINSTDTSKYWDLKYTDNRTARVNILGTQNITLYAVPFRIVSVTVRCLTAAGVTITVPPHAAGSSENISLAYSTASVLTARHDTATPWAVTLPELSQPFYKEYGSEYTADGGFIAVSKLTYTATGYAAGSATYSPGAHVFTENITIDTTYGRTDEYKRKYTSLFWDDHHPVAGETTRNSSTVTVWTGAWSAYGTVSGVASLNGTSPSAPAAWDGYSFSGWTTKVLIENGALARYDLPFSNGDIIGAGQTIPIADNLVYYAVWEGSGTVTYTLPHAQDSTCQEYWPDQTPTTEYTLTGYIGENKVHNIIPEVPARRPGRMTFEDHVERDVPGWGFKGWSQADNTIWYAYGTAQSQIAVRPGAAIVLSPGWNPMDTYTVVFAITPAVEMTATKIALSAPAIAVKASNTNVLPESLPAQNERLGLTWSVSRDGSAKEVTKVGDVWTVDAGTPSAKALSVYLGEVRPADIYTFRGWNNYSDSVSKYASTTIASSPNRTAYLYTLYSTKYSVTAHYYLAYPQSGDPVPLKRNNVPVTTSAGPIDAGEAYAFAPAMSTVPMARSYAVPFTLTSIVPNTEESEGYGVFNGWDNLGTAQVEVYPPSSQIPNYAVFTSYIQSSMEVNFVVDWTTTYSVHLFMGIPEDGYATRQYVAQEWEANIGGSGHTIEIPNLSRLIIPADDTYVTTAKQPMWYTDKVYLGDHYNEEGTALPTTGAIRYVNDTLTIDIANVSDLPNGSALINLFAEQRHSVYTLAVWKGETTATTTSDRYDKSVTYYGTSHNLSILDFATEAERDELEDGGAHAFLGLARTRDGVVEYTAGQDYSGVYLNSVGAYPEEGETVEFYAKWGSYVNEIREGALTIDSAGFTIDYTVGPSDAANARVVLSNSLPNGVTASLTQVGPNTTRVKVEFGEAFTAGNVSLTVVPAYPNPDPNVVPPSQSVSFRVSSLSFTNEDSTAGVEPDQWSGEGLTPMVLLPSRFYWIRRNVGTETAGLTVSLSGYDAVSGEQNHEFGGWTTLRNGSLVDQVAFLANSTESLTVKAAWKSTFVYDLDGGSWDQATPQETTVYYTYYTGQRRTITALIPVHKTRLWSAWYSEGLSAEYSTIEGESVFAGYSVPMRAGNIVIRAIWVCKNLEWYWADTQYTATGPFTHTEDGVAVRYMEAHPVVTWIQQSAESMKAIAINTNDNIISHVTDLDFPPKDYATVKVYLIGSTNPIWAKSYMVPDTISPTQTIDIDEFPKTVYDSTHGYIVGGIYLPNVTGGWSPYIEGGSSVTVPIAPGEETAIYINHLGVDANGVWEWDEDTLVYEETSDQTTPRVTWKVVAPIFNEIQGFSTVDASFTSGRADTDNGNWVLLSNKYPHEIDAMLSEEPTAIRTYKIVVDSAGNRIFREVYETWLAGTTQATSHLVKTGQNTYGTVEGYGSVRTSERADAGQYAVVFSVYTAETEKLYVMLMEVIDEAPVAPLCVITKYPTKDKNMAQKLYLSESGQPNIVVTKVRRSGRVQLTQSPMLTKSSQFNYIIDTGNTEKFTFTVTRTPPMKVDDTDENHPEKWSTNKWMDYVKTFFDQWQNANYNVYGERSGGYNLIFDPLISYNGYPKIDKNVFLSAPLEYNFNRAEVTLTFQFTVASMLGRHAAKQRTIRFYYPIGPEEWGWKEVDSYNGIFTVPEFPADVERQSGSIPACWAYNTKTTGGATVTRYVVPGDEVYENQLLLETSEGVDAPVVKFSVRYREVLGIIVYDVPTETGEVKIPNEFIWNTILPNKTEVYVNCTAVGGGGGGGDSHAFGWKATMGNGPEKFTVKSYELGGGGGSGFVRSRQIRIQKSEAADFILSLGSGGGPQKAGGNSTVVYESESGNIEVVRAAGGSAGTKFKPGSDCNPGGEHATAKDGTEYHWVLPPAGGEEPMKGSQGEPRSAVNGVAGGMGFGADVPSGHYPSSGGGAAPINTVYEVSGNAKIYTVTETGFAEGTDPIRIKSIGGSIVRQTIEETSSGADDEVYVYADSAKYGGGGCSKLDYRDYDLVTKEVRYEVGTSTPSGGIGALFTPSVWKAAVTNITGLWNQGSNWVTETFDYGDCNYDTPGCNGADGVIILEFLGDVETDGSGE